MVRHSFNRLYIAMLQGSKHPGGINLSQGRPHRQIRLLINEPITAVFNGHGLVNRSLHRPSHSLHYKSIIPRGKVKGFQRKPTQFTAFNVYKTVQCGINDTLSRCIANYTPVFMKPCILCLYRIAQNNTKPRKAVNMQ